MEIPEDIMNNLKCSICANYLSSTPIMVKPNGDSICGRCSVPKEEKHLAIRNNAYEMLVSKMSFPCRYTDKGCALKLPVSELEDHEPFCDYHKLKCPILPTGSCQWDGCRSELVQHYRDQHDDAILEHPCVIKPNFDKNIEQSYVTLFGEQIFLVLLKYNESSCKMWHCVRLINNPKTSKHYSYKIEITGFGVIKLLDNSDVLEQNFFQIYEDSIREFDVGSILMLLGKKEDIKISMTIKEKMKAAKCNGCNADISINSSLEIGYCSKCNGGSVIDCVISAALFCQFKHLGCLYSTDEQINLLKHETWFCDYNKTCIHCDVTTKEIDLFNHYASVHVTGPIFESNVLSRVNLYVSIKYNNSIILNDNIFLCEWKFTKSFLDFKILSNLSKTDNKLYKCILKVINPKTNIFEKFSLVRDDSSENYDWLGILNTKGSKPLIHSFVSQGKLKSMYLLELTINKSDD